MYWRTDRQSSTPNARVPPCRPGGPARAAGNRRNHHLTRRAAGQFSGPVSVAGGHEPLPLRLPRLDTARLPLLARADRALPGPAQRPPARPHRPAPGGHGRTRPGVAARREQRRAAPARHRQRRTARPRGPGPGPRPAAPGLPESRPARPGAGHPPATGRGRGRPAAGHEPPMGLVGPRRAPGAARGPQRGRPGRLRHRARRTPGRSRAVPASGGAALRRRSAACRRQIAVRQGTQKSHQIAHIRLTEAGPPARASAEGGLGVHIRLVLGRQIVVLFDAAIAAAREDPLRPGIPIGIEAHRVLQPVIDPIVEKGLTHRHVAQAGGLEQTTVFGVVFQVGAQGAAQAQVEPGRIGIGADGLVARHAQGDQAMVGELWKRPALDRARVALQAVALVLIIEHRHAAALGGVECGLATQEGVITAVVGVEVGRALLEHLQRPEQALPGLVGLAQRLGTKGGAKSAGTGRGRQPRDHVRRAAIGHLQQRQQGHLGLLMRRIGAPIPGAPPRGALVDAVVAVAVIEVLAERRRGLPVTQ